MASKESDKHSRIQKKIDQLTGVIAFNAGLPVGQINGGPITVEQSLEKWTKSQSGSQGSVLLTSQKGATSSEAYDTVTINDNGWVRCRNDGDDSTVLYPPHRVLEIER